jgi:hypothetical protein
LGLAGRAAREPAWRQMPLLSASAGVLVWRLTVKLRRGEAFAESADRIASRVGGALLFALSAYVVASAGWKPWTHHGADLSTPRLIVSVLAIPIMYFLSHRKRALAKVLGSRALPTPLPNSELSGGGYWCQQWWDQRAFCVPPRYLSLVRCAQFSRESRSLAPRV